MKNNMNTNIRSLYNKFKYNSDERLKAETALKLVKCRDYLVDRALGSVRGMKDGKYKDCPQELIENVIDCLILSDLINLNNVKPIPLTQINKKVKSETYERSIEKMVKHIISDILEFHNEDQISLESEFVKDLGLSELDMVELLMAIEEEFDIEIPDEDIDINFSMGDMIRYISNAPKRHQDKVDNKLDSKNIKVNDVSITITDLFDGFAKLFNGGDPFGPK